MVWPDGLKGTEFIQAVPMPVGSSYEHMDTETVVGSSIEDAFLDLKHLQTRNMSYKLESVTYHTNLQQQQKTQCTIHCSQFSGTRLGS